MEKITVTVAFVALISTYIVFAPIGLPSVLIEIGIRYLFDLPLEEDMCNGADTLDHYAKTWFWPVVVPVYALRGLYFLCTSKPKNFR